MKLIILQIEKHYVLIIFSIKTIYPKAKYITYWKMIKTIYGFFHKQESIN